MILIKVLYSSLICVYYLNDTIILKIGSRESDTSSKVKYLWNTIHSSKKCIMLEYQLWLQWYSLFFVCLKKQKHFLKNLVNMKTTCWLVDSKIEIKKESRKIGIKKKKE